MYEKEIHLSRWPRKEAAQFPNSTYRTITKVSKEYILHTNTFFLLNIYVINIIMK